MNGVNFCMNSQWTGFGTVYTILVPRIFHDKDVLKAAGLTIKVSMPYRQQPLGGPLGTGSKDRFSRSWIT